MPPKKRVPLLAALLTLLTAGMGQVYNGRPRKGLLLWASYNAGTVVLFRSGLAHHFWGMVAAMGFCFVGLLAILADAVVGARKARAIEPRRYHRWYVYLLPTFVWFAASIGFEFAARRPLTNAVVGMESFRVPSRSMEPTLVLGDRFFVDRTAYGDRRVERGDVVVFPYPPDPSLTFVKRVVALGGDTVAVKGGELYVNQRRAVEPYVSRDGPTPDFDPVTVPPGEAFVLGDNRGNSSDSRVWGFVKEDAIGGKALFVFWSGDRGRIGREIR